MTTEITFKRGDTFKRTVTYQTKLGIGLDITGYKFYFTVKPCIDNVKDDSSSVIKKDITSFSDPANGKFLLELSSTDTDIKPAEYYYDISYKKTDGSIHTITESPLCLVTGDVTRRVD